MKWYKDNEEFFRYVPRFHPAIHTHPIVPGVHVDVSFIRNARYLHDSILKLSATDLLSDNTFNI